MKDAPTEEKPAPEKGGSTTAIGYFRMSVPSCPLDGELRIAKEKERIAQVAQGYGLGISHVYHDEKPSVDLTDRAGYMMALAHVEAETVDTFICTSMKDLSRSFAEVAAHLSICLKKQVRVIFIDDEIDTHETEGRFLSLAAAGYLESHEGRALAKVIRLRAA